MLVSFFKRTKLPPTITHRKKGQAEQSAGQTTARPCLSSLSLLRRATVKGLQMAAKEGLLMQWTATVWLRRARTRARLPHLTRLQQGMWLDTRPLAWLHYQDRAWLAPWPQLHGLVLKVKAHTFFLSQCIITLVGVCTVCAVAKVMHNFV